MIASAELGLVAEVVVAAPGSSLLSDVCGPYGIRSIWYFLFWLGLISFGKATSETFHVVLRVGPVTLRLLEG